MRAKSREMEAKANNREEEACIIKVAKVLEQRFPTFFGLPHPFRKKNTHRPLFRKIYTPTPVLEINNVTHSFPTLWGHSPLFQTVIRLCLS
jgi:hypothetical protein